MTELDTLSILILRGAPQAALESACSQLGLDPASAITDARSRILAAANYDRDEQVATAIGRLNDLYAKAMKDDDIKTAITAQRELNKIMDLYREAEVDRRDSDSDLSPRLVAAERQLAEIAEHLLPLNLAAADYPLAGHARIAADRVRESTTNVGS